MNTIIRSAALASCLFAASAAVGIADANEGDISAARAEGRISATIALNRDLRGSEIDVAVDGSKATLTGTVTDDVHKQLAEELAMNVEGIDEVDNRIEVDAEFAAEADPEGERSFGDRVDDAALTASVKGKLLWSRHAEAMNTDVDSERGVVTLSGFATTEEAKQAAEKLASSTDGVRSVVNEIEVDPDFHENAGATSLAQAGASGTVSAGDPMLEHNAQATDPDDEDSLTSEASDAWITSKVKATLMASRSVNSFDINVDVEDGVVTLSGELDDEADKELAIELAQNVRGVRNVDGSGLTIG